MDELKSMIKHYTDELEALAEGNLYRIDGELVIRDTDNDDDDYNEMMDEKDLASFVDFLEINALGDTRYEINADGSFHGGKILLAYGGPNIWLYDDKVVGYWGSETDEWHLTSEASAIVYDYLKEEFLCAPWRK